MGRPLGVYLRHPLDVPVFSRRALTLGMPATHSCTPPPSNPAPTCLIARQAADMLPQRQPSQPKQRRHSRECLSVSSRVSEDTRQPQSYTQVNCSRLIVERTVRWGHPKKVLSVCLRPPRLRSRQKPVVGRRFMMPGLCWVYPDVVIKTLSRIDLPSSAISRHFLGRWFVRRDVKTRGKSSVRL